MNSNRTSTRVGWITPAIKWFAPAMVGLVLMLGACAKKDDGGGGGVVATTPACNSTTGSCDPSFYGNNPYLTIPGVQTYGNGSPYCGCTSGSQPIYGAQYGFACVPQQYMTYSGYMGYSVNNIYQPQNGYTNMQQVQYTPVQAGYNTGGYNTGYNSGYTAGNTCYNNVASSCDVRLQNSCSNGGTCQAIGGGTTVGVCTAGYGNTSYNNGGYYGNQQGYTGTLNGYNTYYQPGYNNYGGGYYGGNNRCTIKTNSWGLTYWYCL